MKNFRQLTLVVLLCIVASGNAQRSMNKVIEKGLSVSREQSLIMAKSLEAEEGRFPRSFQNGELVTSDYRWWCSGFFPGVLWMLYGDASNGSVTVSNGTELAQELRRYAELFTDWCEPVKKMTDTHDLGFMLYCSFGQGYNLTCNPRYLDIIKEGTQSLLTRYNDKIGVIKSWESGPKWKYPVIIDNMMNLEMLCFMTRETNDPYFMKVAKRHADTTLKNHFREDYSTYHVVSYDPATGEPHAKQTHQGYADNSAWARGQAWGLYGYTMMYRETQDPVYLEQARHIANFICSHPCMPKDGIPYWDFDAPKSSGKKGKAGEDMEPLRDASAAACMASAFIELSQLDKTVDSSRWLKMAEKQLRTLSSQKYLAKSGEQGGFILKHSVGSLPANSEIDVPLTYADYYYVEALLRMKKLLHDTSSRANR